jgi:hypothetical protein
MHHQSLIYVVLNPAHAMPSLAPTDSCHSGTLLDQTEVQIDGPKEDDPVAPEETECACVPAANQR